VIALSSTRPNLSELLESALPVALRHIPLRIRDVAAALDIRAALVGGIPRDLLRIRYGQLPVEAYRGILQDFDIIVEGDAIAFAYELVRRLPGKLTVNRDFGTASIATDDPVVIDVVGARREHYPTPGYLPVVDFGASLEEDALRRDFTVNCVAVELGEDYGALLDTVGGEGDVQARLLRTLHARSFFEDPTRLFRALRYTARLGYDFEATTRKQFDEAIDDGNVDALSPERVRHELELVCREERWADIWQAMHFSGLLHSVHPALLDVYSGWLPSDARALDIAIRSRTELLEAEGVEPWLLRTAWALGGVETAQLESVCKRLGLFQRHVRWIIEARRALQAADAERIVHIPPSMACHLLEKFARQSIIIATFIFQPRSNEDVLLRKTLLRYVEELSQVRSELGSDELRGLGLSPGPAFGELRNRLRYMRVDGIISSVDEERDYARQYIAGLSAEPEED
jgi:tRNA nucleotidyltransferase (CCA-adding enzyme)